MSKIDFEIPLTVWGVSEYAVKAIQMGDIGIAYDLLLSQIEITHREVPARAEYLKLKRLARRELRKREVEKK